jgi:hypothetical protein
MPSPFTIANYNITYSQTVNLGINRGYFFFNVTAGVSLKITVVDNVIGLTRHGNYDGG